MNRCPRSARLLSTILASLSLAYSGPLLAAAANPDLSANAYFSGSDEPRRASLTIDRLDLNVEVVGSNAQTSALFTFRNPNGESLEGEFTFALPADSTVTGYALDNQERMVEGVLVDRREGTRAYEASMRRGIDPGIAEVTSENAFLTRVFPLLPGKARTIRLDFVTPLSTERPFVLPLEQERPLDTLSLHVSVAHQTIAPRLRAPSGLHLAWTRDGSGFEAQAEISGVALSGALEIGPFRQSSPVTVSRHRNGEVFFEIHDTAPRRGFVHASRVRIYWDNSLARADDDLEAEIALLERFVAFARPRTIDIVTFSDAGAQSRTFAASQKADLVEAVWTLPYAGTISYDRAFAPELPAADFCLLFSNGAVAIDPYRIERQPCQLFAISSASNTHRMLLQTLAARFDGEHLDLNVLSVDQAMAELLRPPPRIEFVTTRDSMPIRYVALPAEGNRFRIVGKAPASAGIVVSFADGNERTRTYTLPRGAPRHDGIGAFLAMHHLARLKTKEHPDPDAILSIARRYSVATDSTVFSVQSPP